MLNTLKDLFNTAVAYHQQGNLPAAEALYRRLLEADAEHADAYHLVGLLEHQRGRSDLAIPLIRKAIELKPTSAPFHINLGIALCEQGLVAEAAASQREALRLEPNRPDALSNLALALRTLGELPEAADCCRKALAIEPRQPHALNILGNIYLDQKQPAEAAICYQKALGYEPLFAEALVNLSLALKEQGQAAEALVCCHRALAINPGNLNALHNMGLALQALGELKQAAACFREVLQKDSRHVNAQINLGNVLLAQRRLAEAASCYENALRLSPNNAAAYKNLGIALERQGFVLQAVETFQQALKLDPCDAEAHNNLGAAFTVLGNYADALRHFEKALQADARFDKARWNRSLIRLLHGNFESGWPEYEYRRAQSAFAPRHTDRPVWDGSDLPGKTILVHAEQGLGDTIQFARYIPLVKERGGRVLFECQKPLINLMKTVKGADAVIAAGAELPAFEVHAPLLSLPGIFRTRLETIPANIAYLKAQDEKVESWRMNLQAVKGFKVGIAWQGNTEFHSDRFRSVPLSFFKRLAGIQGVNLISVQVGPGRQQLAEAGFPVIDLAGDFDGSSMDDVAGVLKNLDLLISSDTSVPHLAGALGVTVWMALHGSPDWRWLLEREDSPWYPTMRLFRQRRFGEWGEVFGRIADALMHRIGF